jgi:hypothetical protein
VLNSDSRFLFGVMGIVRGSCVCVKVLTTGVVGIEAILLSS